MSKDRYILRNEIPFSIICVLLHYLYKQQNSAIPWKFMEFYVNAILNIKAKCGYVVGVFEHNWGYCMAKIIKSTEESFSLK